MTNITLEDIWARLAVLDDRTERMEQILTGSAQTNAGVVTRLAGVESRLDVQDKALLKAGGVGAAAASLFSALTALILRQMGV